MSPALAKMPGFTMEVVPQGDQVEITVIVRGVDSAGFDAPNLHGLVALYPAEALDDRGRPLSHAEAIPVDLQRVETGVFQGTVTVPGDGRWAAVPFPDSDAFEPSWFVDTYPGTVFFEAYAHRSTETIWAMALGALLTSGLIRLGSKRGTRRSTNRSSREALGSSRSA
ncbi:MAG: hypothetical protein ACRDWA_06635 [Acidimicrobiia bacterium]